jgi:hypothetical protein
MDVILDANAYISVLHKYGRKFVQTNQFAELLIYLRRTRSRLVIPELTYNEVIVRYRDRLMAVAKTARDAWSTLQEVSMKERFDFIEPDINDELCALGELLNQPAPGVQAVIYNDYSGVDVREVAQRGIGRVRPANEEGEELRDVILWLLVLHYARQTKTPVAFVSGDKTFQDDESALHPALRKDLERAKVNITFYPFIRDFVKGNALEAEPIKQEALSAYITDQELRGISTEQLLGSRFWGGTIVSAEVSRCELAEARRYRVGEDSYYIEARYTGDGTVRLSKQEQTYVLVNNSPVGSARQVITGVPAGVIPDYSQYFREPLGEPLILNNLAGVTGGTIYHNSVGATWVPGAPEDTYMCSFSLRLSLRIAKGARQALEVDEFVFLGELTPIAASNS